MVCSEVYMLLSCILYKWSHESNGRVMTKSVSEQFLCNFLNLLSYTFYIFIYMAFLLQELIVKYHNFVPGSQVIQVQEETVCLQSSHVFDSSVHVFSTRVVL